MQSAPSLQSIKPTMSSREIAELTGKDHGHVLRDIRNMLKELYPLLDGFEDIGIIFTKRDDNGQTSSIHLPKDETLCLMSGYDVKARMTIIKRWQELEAKESKPVANLSDASTLRELLLGYTEQVIQLQETVEAQKPAVEFVSKYVEAENLLGFRQVAKLLQVKEPNFRDFLLANKIMYKLGDGWVAYSQHLDAGRFRASTGIAENEHAYTSHKFTANGVERIAGLMASKQVLQIRKNS